MGNTIRMVPPEGGAAVEVPVEEAQIYVDREYTPQSSAARASEAVEAGREEYYSEPANVAKAALAAGARTFTGGGSDAIIRGLGGDDARRELEGLREHNKTLSTVIEIGGSLLPVGVGGLANRAAGLIGKGTGAASQIARAGARGVVEGGIMGAGQGVTEVALSDEPLSVDRALSAIGSGALYGGVTGGVAGAAGKGLELGLARAKVALDKVAAKGLDAGADVADDLGKLDGKGLRAARKVELEAIETAQVPRRAEVATEIKAFRKDLKDNKLWLATQKAEEREVREIGKITLDADRGIDKLLRDPKALAESPQVALKHLRVQEAALDDLVTKHSDSLRAKFAGDTSGDRLKSLDFASVALEKNRALQGKLTELTAKPTSQRLDAIADALEARSMPKASSDGLSGMLGQSALGHAVGMAAGVPMLGPVVLAGKAVAGVVKKLGANSAEIAARGSRAVDMFLGVTKKVAPHAPIVASKVLAEVRYGSRQRRDESASSKRPTLAASYKARADEIRALVEPGPTGLLQMRHAARMQMSERLAAVRAVSPMLADRLETAAVRRMEFLANKMPRRPDIGGVQIGPDTWQPSDMEMRTFARYVAAVEDPHQVVERMSDGSMTPEDAEAVREVYPEMHADITRQIVEQLPTLRKKLPYSNRLALSMFTDVAVDPAMDPRILGILQSTYAAEAGSEGGAQAPKPEPAFGSVSKDAATPAQQRG